MVMKEKNDLKLAVLINSLPDRFEIDEREVENSHIRHIYVRNRQK